jgi:anti-sigma-K factor RskA
MDLHRNPGLLDSLAAEHALGTLRGGARRRLDRIALSDEVVRQALFNWQRRFSAITELVASEAPPETVWRAIEAQLSLSYESSAAPVRTPQRSSVESAVGWFQSLSFWRGWSFAATAVALVLLFGVVQPWKQFTTPTTRQQANNGAAANPESRIGYVAVLNDDKAQAVMLVTWNQTDSTMTVRRLSERPVPSDKALELWGLPAKGHPVALGMLPAGGQISLPVSGRPQDLSALAISIEAPGGSPNPNAPTGPVVFSGKLVPTT